MVVQVNGNETLMSVAARFDTTVSELKKLNRLMTDVIWPGKVWQLFELGMRLTGRSFVCQNFYFDAT